MPGTVGDYQVHVVGGLCVHVIYIKGLVSLHGRGHVVQVVLLISLSRIASHECFLAKHRLFLGGSQKLASVVHNCKRRLVVNECSFMECGVCILYSFD